MQKGARKGISHATGVPQQAYERSAQGDSHKCGRSGDHWNIVSDHPVRPKWFSEAAKDFVAVGCWTYSIAGGRQK